MRNHIYCSRGPKAEGEVAPGVGTSAPPLAQWFNLRPLTTRRALRALTWGSLWGLGLALAASGCGTQSSDACAGSAACVTLNLSTAGLDPALGSAVGLDDLELIVRVGDTTRRVRFDDRVVSAPGGLPLTLPELATNPQQRVAIYLRASARALGSYELGATVERAAAEPLQSSYPLALSRTCVATPCAIPEPRRGASLAMDPHSRHLVLFGGRRQDGTALADTWEWDGLGWHSVVTGSAPAARAGHTVALDARRGTLLLFGGAGGDEAALQPLADTWEYLGAAAGWHHLADSGPPARHQAAMASAAIADANSLPGVLLYGGTGAAGRTLGDTWVWDGQTWSAPPQQSDSCPDVPPLTPTLPRCRSQAGLMPAAAQQALLVGGRLGQPGLPAETDDVVWRWDGARWSPAPVYRPPTVLGRYAHFAGSASAAPFPLSLVAFGDSASGLRQDSFLLDAQSGQFAPQLGIAPDPRAEAAAAYDEERDEVLLLGGRGLSALWGDTWSFTPTAGWRAHK